MSIVDRGLLPSVLDRLLEPAPKPGQPDPKARGQSIRELRASLSRDLEALLNARRRCLGWPTEFEELEASLLAYGLPDMGGTDLAVAEAQEAFCRAMEQTIRLMEPRYVSVRVELLSKTDPLDPTLRFRINALVHAEPTPEPLVLDSVFDPATRRHQIGRNQGGRTQTGKGA